MEKLPNPINDVDLDLEREEAVAHLKEAMVNQLPEWRRNKARVERDHGMNAEQNRDWQASQDRMDLMLDRLLPLIIEIPDDVREINHERAA